MEFISILDFPIDACEEPKVLISYKFRNLRISSGLIYSLNCFEKQFQINTLSDLLNQIHNA